MANQITTPSEYQMADGFKLRTKVSIWLDGKEKAESIKAYKDEYGEKEGLVKWREEVDAKHEASIEFDFTDVNLDDLLKKAATSSNSLVVWWQNSKRPMWRKEFDSDEQFAEWLSAQPTFVISVKDWIEANRRSGGGADFGKAKKFVEKTDDAEALKKLKAELEAKLAELESK